MNRTLTFLTGTSLWLLTGCLQPSTTPQTNYNTPINNTSTQPLTFHTDEHGFLHPLKSSSNLQSRNTYLDEFLLKSDMQCIHYLNEPLQSTPPQNDYTDSLYMGIADTVGTIFGIRYITETAKTVFLNNSNKNLSEEKKAYSNALSPEIKKGVEIGRRRFAKEMIKKKSLPIDKYTPENLKEDTQLYDKQCNLEYGLIEINRALKAMQASINKPSRTITAKKETIDVKVIKKKVKEATKEVQKKEIKEKSKPKKIKNHGILSI